MGIRRTETVHDFQLTDAELEIAHQIDHPEAKRILRRDGANIGKPTAAFYKIASRARAERLAYQELNLLAATRDQITSLLEAHVVIAEAQKQIRGLERELEKERSNHVKELAAPAMVVHAEPTGR